MYNESLIAAERQKKQEAREKIVETARVLLPMLEEAAASLSDTPRIAKVGGIWLGEDYIQIFHQDLTRIINGERVNYEAICQRIPLSVTANSSVWAELRIWALRLT